MPLWAEGSAYWTLNRLGIEQALNGRLNLSGPRLASVPTFAAKSQSSLIYSLAHSLTLKTQTHILPSFCSVSTSLVLFLILFSRLSIHPFLPPPLPPSLPPPIRLTLDSPRSLFLVFLPRSQLYPDLSCIPI